MCSRTSHSVTFLIKGEMLCYTYHLEIVVLYLECSHNASVGCTTSASQNKVGESCSKVPIRWTLYVLISYNVTYRIRETLHAWLSDWHPFTRVKAANSDSGVKSDTLSKAVYYRPIIQLIYKTSAKLCPIIILDRLRTLKRCLTFVTNFVIGGKEPRDIQTSAELFPPDFSEWSTRGLCQPLPAYNNVCIRWKDTCHMLLCSFDLPWREIKCFI